MKIRNKEMGLGMVLAVLIATLSIYMNNLHVKETSSFRSELFGDVSGLTVTELGGKQIRENIQGELRKGTFENVTHQLETLTQEKGGLVYSLYMTYKDELWSGIMISHIPQENTSSFVFKTREIIGANGRVASITTSIVYGDEGVTYATIETALKEIAGAETPQPILQVLSVVPLLVTGLVWIAEGLIIGVPLCFISLGIVLLVNRGLLPVWKRQLKKLQWR